MISFIVPAHNEQACLGRTLPVIHESARAVGRPYEVIVVDDASTDATAEVARRHKATILPVHHRQIAATRNFGGRAARGDRLFFVDADTTINPRAVAAALRYSSVEKVWYDSNRADDDKMPDTLAVRISNAIALLFGVDSIGGLDRCLFVAGLVLYAKCDLGLDTALPLVGAVMQSHFLAPCPSLNQNPIETLRDDRLRILHNHRETGARPIGAFSQHGPLNRVNEILELHRVNLVGEG
jgi:hypothetical protein